MWRIHSRSENWRRSACIAAASKRSGRRMWSLTCRGLYLRLYRSGDGHDAYDQRESRRLHVSRLHVAGISSLALSGRTHAVSVLAIVTSMCALVLGVTLYALTRE